MSDIFKAVDVVKPYKYPFAYEIYMQHEKMHWIKEKVPLHQDVKDYSDKLTDSDKEFLTQNFRLFTQNDKDVSDGYYDNYIPIFKRPELRMMMGSFANREATHIDSYSNLIDTLGMKSSIYADFLEISEMREKHEYALKVSPYYTDALGKQHLDYRGIARTIAIYSGFIEGLCLFSQFSMLLNYQRSGLMNGMCTIVEYSIKDESVHVEGMIKTFHAIIEENPDIWDDSLKSSIYQACRDIIDMEDKFLDLVYSKFNMNDTALDKGKRLTLEDMKQFNRYIADHRLQQLGLKPNYGVKTHNLEWIEYVINSVVHNNFFESTGTEYSKGGIIGNRSSVTFE